MLRPSTSVFNRHVSGKIGTRHCLRFSAPLIGCQQTRPVPVRYFRSSSKINGGLNTAAALKEDNDPDAAVVTEESELPRPEHAVISTFDLFSIGGSCFTT